MDELQKFNEREALVLENALTGSPPAKPLKVHKDQLKVIELEDIEDNYYYSVINGLSEGFASSVNVHLGSYIKQNWAKLEYNKYSSSASLPSGYILVELPDDTALAARVYGILIKG